MKRTGFLFESTASFENLAASAWEAASGKRSRHDVARFLFELEVRILELQSELLDGTYRPGPYHVFRVRDPKDRQICAAPFRDRVVHHAVCRSLAPLFERRFIHDSWACRPGKGSHQALRRCQGFARAGGWFLKCDIRKFYDSVSHAVLRERLGRLLKDRRLLELLDRIIANVPPESRPGRGIPIGNLTSQHFANLYLDPLDHWIRQELRPAAYLRYMDDFVLFGRSREELTARLGRLREFLGERLALELNERRTLQAPVWRGIPFLGFQVFPGTIRARRSRFRRSLRRLRDRVEAFRRGRLAADRLTQSAASICAHWEHGRTRALRAKALEGLWLEI